MKVRKKAGSSGYSSVSGSPTYTPPPDKNLPGQISKLKHTATLSAQAVDEQSKLLFSASPYSAAKNAVEEYQFSYSSRDPRGNRPIQITGRAYLPAHTSGLDGIVFGPGTTGPGAICAPSLEQSRLKNWGQYDKHLAYYAGLGYPVITTDYDNRTTNQDISHYFVGEVEGRAMLDAARALRNFVDTRRFAGPVAKNSFFMTGFSQGGHAALWADQINSSYAPDVTIKGIIGFAPATDLERTFLDTVNGTATIWLPPYLLAAYNDYYQVDISPASILLEPYAASLRTDATANCIDQLELHSGHYGSSTNTARVYTQLFIDSLHSNTFSQNFPILSNLLKKNLAGSQAPNAPTLTITGDKDFVILASAQDDLTRRLCKFSKVAVGLSIYPGANHYNILSVGAANSVAWMQQVAEGRELANDCARFSL